LFYLYLGEAMSDNFDVETWTDEYSPEEKRHIHTLNHMRRDIKRAAGGSGVLPKIVQEHLEALEWVLNLLRELEHEDT